MKRERIFLMLATVCLGCITAGSVIAEPQDEQTDGIQIGQLVYADGRTGTCFSVGFLDVLARHTNIRVNRDRHLLTLGKDSLAEYPFVILTGEGSFELPDDQLIALRDYLRGGGFVLASAGCSNKAWAESFGRTMKKILPRDELKPLKMDHPMFHTVFDITKLRAKKGRAQQQLLGLHIDGRLVMAFCPLGLNDTANAGGGCCCCGGNELRDAHLLNANILAYVLMN